MKSVLRMYEECGISFEQSRFVSGGQAWTAPYLYDKVKELGLKPERVNLRHIDLSRMPWGGGDGAITSMDDFLFNAVRIQNVDTTIPIIIAWDGEIMDGWHRVARAILDGDKTIKAYRFNKQVEADVKNIEN